MKLGYTAAGIFTPVIFIGLLTCRKRALENAVHAAADNSSEAAQTAKNIMMMKSKKKIRHQCKLTHLSSAVKEGSG